MSEFLFVDLQRRVNLNAKQVPRSAINLVDVVTQSDAGQLIKI